MIKSYSLINQEEQWDVFVKGEFLKMCEIVQSDDAQMLALAYQDDGLF